MENNDLISRSDALELCQNEYDKRLKMFDYCGDTVAYNIGGAIKLLPAVDAAPVVHERWEEADWVEPDGHGFGCVRKHKAALRCTNCRCCFKKELLWKNNFCPSCGARMDGKEPTNGIE